MSHLVKHLYNMTASTAQAQLMAVCSISLGPETGEHSHEDQDEKSPHQMRGFSFEVGLKKNNFFLLDV